MSSDITQNPICHWTHWIAGRMEWPRSHCWSGRAGRQMPNSSHWQRVQDSVYPWSWRWYRHLHCGDPVRHIQLWAGKTGNNKCISVCFGGWRETGILPVYWSLCFWLFFANLSKCMCPKHMQVLMYCRYCMCISMLCNFTFRLCDSTQYYAESVSTQITQSWYNWWCNTNTHTLCILTVLQSCNICGHVVQDVQGCQVFVPQRAAAPFPQRWYVATFPRPDRESSPQHPVIVSLKHTAHHYSQLTHLTTERERETAVWIMV